VCDEAGTDTERKVLGSIDRYLLNEGRHFRLHHSLGAHVDGDGVTFAVWAPDAQAVSVIGDRNGWRAGADPLAPQGATGVWAGRLAGWQPGDCYKYRVEGRNGFVADKADPLAAQTEAPPATASIVADLDYEWHDDAWMTTRGERQRVVDPVAIYEVHLGSWRRGPSGEPLGYREVAPRLAEYVCDLGFTHVELLPIMEHPFAGSWGYQTTGYFAPTARFGTPTDFMWFVDTLHQAGIGVILDWVPSHFPDDPHGLARFDGTHLYEHADPRLGFHPDWHSCIFNYGRREVRSFLVSSACCWLERYHADGLRVDAVASMLYRDYSRGAGEWIPNEHGGRENLDAITVLRELNDEIRSSFPDVRTFAEESTAWPGVTAPPDAGGLGFTFKWDMGWMHDTLRYVAREPVHRQYHHDDLTFRTLYAWSERYVLPLSHDEVVHGKGSLLNKAPGDEWQRLATLRTLLATQWTTPGKPLLFMGAEVAQPAEWNHDAELAWWRLQDAGGAGTSALVRDLNALMRGEPALFERDHEPAGFEWVVGDDAAQSVFAWLRTATRARPLLVVANWTPVPRHDYRLGVPSGGRWRELINTDAACYGGSGVGNLGGVDAVPVPYGPYSWSVTLTLPPLGVLALGPELTPRNDGTR
jgi:1,4-alpha-glucan branching enzyme